ncbi:putative allantoate permease [Hyaloscypha finlandica]|nr:putative allantoate permease [Hyaloscypha finlandica]
MTSSSKEDEVSTVEVPNSVDVDHDQIERRVLRKIDLRLVPLLIICYFLQYLDKATLGFASIMGIIEDNNLQGQEYSWANSIFFFGYLAFTFPTSVLIVKFPIGKYVSITVMVWAIILMLHAATHNFSGLMAVRFFLGVGEATVVPAFALLIGTFYKREEQPFRQCAFFLGDGIAGILGGLIVWGIAHIQGKLQTWKYLFLIYGAITAFFGAILFFTLPDGPSKSKFLTEEERAIAVDRVQMNGGKKVVSYQRYQVIEALSDPQAWLLVLNTFCVNVATGGLSSFGYILIQGFGFSLFSTLLLQMPAGAAQIIFVCIGAYFGTYVKNARLLTMVFFMLVSITGTAMMFAIPAQHRVARFAGSCLASAFSANLPMATSMVTSNIAGFTKKATVMAMIFVAYCVGRIAGPQFFLQSEYPKYPTGLKAILAVFSCAAVIALILRAYLMWENAKRDKEAGATLGASNESSELSEIDENFTDRENRNFRYLL